MGFALTDERVDGEDHLELQQQHVGAVQVVQDENDGGSSQEDFLDDNSSSLPPDYWENFGEVGNRTTNHQPKRELKKQKSEITAPTAALSSSLGESTGSFSFEITLPPPSDVSPLS